MNQQHNIEALKAALAAAKAVHREAMKAVDDARRAAVFTRCDVGRAQSAYIAALPPRPRPARVKDPEADNPFAPSPPREEVA